MAAGFNTRRSAMSRGRGTGDATLIYLADLETAAAFVAAFGLELAGG